MIREPFVAGKFYPSSPDLLKNKIKEYIDSAKCDIYDNIKVLISPHAGYRYSGPVAAYTYKQLLNKTYDTAVILALSHQTAFEGASIIPEGIYKTPIDDSIIDTDIAQPLFNEKYFGFESQLHIYEHSLEVQVPFLQYVSKNTKIVPILVGAHNLITIKSIAESIYKIISKSGKKIIVIVSTDLSHFYDYDTAVKLDRNFIDTLKTLNPEIVADSVLKGKSSACGIAPVLTGMYYANLNNVNFFQELKYLNSGDTAGGKSEVVGYLSGFFS